MALSHSAVVFYFNIPFVIWDMMIFFAFLWKIYIVNDSKTRKLSLSQQILHNISLSSFMLATTCDMLHGFGAYISNTNILSHHVVWVFTVHVLADAFYYTSSLSLYIILINRLFSTFSNTAYAISNWFYYWISVQILIQIILMIAYIMILIIDDCQSRLGCDRMGLASGLITANDYILNIVCIALFVKKLRELIVTKLKTEVSEWMDQESSKSVKAYVNEVMIDNKMNNNLLTVITKQTVIGTFVTLINQLFATCAFFMLLFDTPETVDRMVMIAYLLRGVEGAFLCSLLYIALIINEKEYNKTCKYCHRACYNLCLYLTAKTVKRRVKQSEVKRNNNDYVALNDVETK